MKTEAKKEQERNFFTVDQLVEYLGPDLIRKTTIQAKIRSGEIPTICLGHKKLIPASWVKEFCMEED